MTTTTIAPYKPRSDTLVAATEEIATWLTTTLSQQSHTLSAQAQDLTNKGSPDEAVISTHPPYILSPQDN
jgi:hypothetical protein